MIDDNKLKEYAHLCKQFKETLAAHKIALKELEEFERVLRIQVRSESDPRNKDNTVLHYDGQKYVAKRVTNGYDIRKMNSDGGWPLLIKDYMGGILGLKLLIALGSI